MIGYVFCKAQFHALHCYPDAPDNVAFLRQPHRHLFKVKCFAPIDHDNRDIEFVHLKGMIQDFCIERFSYSNLGHKSCEMIGREILDQFECLSHVEVSEDGENGCIVYKMQECKCECECGGECNGQNVQ